MFNLKTLQAKLVLSKIEIRLVEENNKKLNIPGICLDVSCCRGAVLLFTLVIALQRFLVVFMSRPFQGKIFHVLYLARIITSNVMITDVHVTEAKSPFVAVSAV